MLSIGQKSTVSVQLSGDSMETLKITQEHITWFPEPKDCFFHYGNVWCPGWAIGQIELPIVPCYSRSFTLVRDSTGESHWFPANKVLFRNDSHLFDSYIGNSFDWARIHTFQPLIS